MPGDVVWRQDGAQATLVCGPWQARVDALRPTAGLTEVSYGGVPLAESSFLGVDINVDAPTVAADCYQRGGDFIARYLQTNLRPFAIVVYWRVGWFEHGGHEYPRIDLVVSVETSLLDSRPQLSAVTNLRLDTGALVYSGDGYLLAPFRKPALRYAEICHPDDSISTLIETIAQPASTSHLEHVRCVTPLFGQPLEKGVILRSRLRGLFIPGEGSEAVARAARDELAGSPPPLTT